MIEQCYSQIGAAIRALRRSRGLSQQQLADALGYERFSSVSDLERGKIRLHVHQLLRLAELFDIPVQSLLSGSVQEQQRNAMVIKDTPWREW